VGGIGSLKGELCTEKGASDWSDIRLISAGDRARVGDGEAPAPIGTDDCLTAEMTGLSNEDGERLTPDLLSLARFDTDGPAERGCGGASSSPPSPGKRKRTGDGAWMLPRLSSTGTRAGARCSGSYSSLIGPNRACDALTRATVCCNAFANMDGSGVLGTASISVDNCGVR
jgi:hypothetical protein